MVAKAARLINRFYKMAAPELAKLDLSYLGILI
jgi:hypothetical protein